MPDDTGGNDRHDPVPVSLPDYELRFHTLAKSCSYGLFQVSTGNDCHVLYANRMLAAMLGYDSARAITGLEARGIFINPADFDTLYLDIVQDGIITGREVRFRQKDGSEIWVSLQAWQLTYPGGMVIEGFVQDITEQRVLEAEMQYHASELNRYALALANANKKLNLLSSITRHDLLNKLTILQGQLELMKMESTDPAILSYLSSQEKTIQALTLHVQFTRDYQDLGIDSPRWSDVNEIIRTSVASLSLLGIDVVIDTGTLWVYADPMLEKVFYNLVENSLRHAGALKKIRFHTSLSEGVARIIYEDDGCGVPAEFKEDIFNRKHFTHTGFGLYLSREILAITGLTIAETGTPGNGARFEIAVPGDRFSLGNPPG
ncbi:MAG: PAS domain-containing sensor histidine kinase [Methanomicrobiales archaeon]|nr:PAS domain-containing sensor histidine kinase [Methanomicrobiales archaeon]